MTSIVLNRSNKPEHDDELDEGEGGGEVELIHEQLGEEDEGQHQPVSEEVDHHDIVYISCTGVYLQLWDFNMKSIKNGNF